MVGLGLNVGWAPPGAARLGPDVDPLDVLAALLAAFDRLPADVTARYRQTLATLGRRVRIEFADGVLDGTATDVDPDGRLVVVDSCGDDPPHRRRRRHPPPLTRPARRGAPGIGDRHR